MRQSTAMRTCADSRRSRLTAIILASLAILASCGNDDDPESTPNTTAEQPAVTTEQPAVTTTPVTVPSTPPSTSSTASEQSATVTGTESTASAAAGSDASDATALEADATAEGSVVVYSAYDPATNDALVAAFSQRYPDVKVELTRLTTADIMQRADAERSGGAPGADVVMHTNRDWFVDRANEGALEKVNGPHIDQLDAELLLADGTSVITTLAVFGYGWNTNAVSEDLAFEDLLDPKYKGRIGTYDIVAQPTFLLYYKYLEDQYGEEFLRALAAQDPVFYASGTPLAQAMAAGEVDVSTVLSAGSITPEVPLTIAYPEVPAATPLIATIPTEARHPSAAALFIDYLVSPEGQEIWANEAVAVIDGISTAAYAFDEVIPLNLQDLPADFFDTYLVKLQDIFGR